MNHGLLNLIAVIILIGIVLGVINRFIPMASAIKSILNLVAVLVCFIYILQFFNVIQNILPMINIIQ